MKAKLNIVFLISISLMVYIIIIAVLFILQKVNQKQSLISEVTIPQAIVLNASTFQASMPNSAAQQALMPQAVALQQIPESSQAVFLVSPVSIVPTASTAQPEQTAAISASIPANSIPSTKAIEESLANQNQRYQMVQEVMAQRKAQEARVRAAVENASPRNEQ